MKNRKKIISLMSGTSLDGVDACLVQIFDDMSFEILNDYSLAYPEEIRKKLLDLANNKGDVRDVCFMNFVTGEFFAKAVKELIKKAEIKKEEVDFISSHGQTVFHMPERNAIGGIETGSTLQIGDISVISQSTGITTVGDFRIKDIVEGGQGAPFVPFADKIIFSAGKNRLIQNIGGISNVTVLSKDCAIFAFDNAPGNMLIDYFTQKLFDKPYDKDGEFALRGKIDKKALETLLNEPYYKIKPPKSTGRELFNANYAEKALKLIGGNNFDKLATVTALTSKAIANSYKDFVFDKTKADEIVLGGGGAFNKTIIKYLREFLPGIEIKTHKDYNIPDKLKECLAFAYLGYFAMQNKPNNVPSCTGAGKAVSGGKISFGERF